MSNKNKTYRADQIRHVIVNQLKSLDFILFELESQLI